MVPTSAERQKKTTTKYEVKFLLQNTIHKNTFIYYDNFVFHFCEKSYWALKDLNSKAGFMSGVRNSCQDGVEQNSEDSMRMAIKRQTAFFIWKF